MILKHLHNEKGLALMMTLLISAISLAVMASLLFLSTMSSMTSGVQKRYVTALEAGVGGEGLMTDFIATRAINPLLTNTISMKRSASITDACMSKKFNEATKDWFSGGCTSSKTAAMYIDPTDPFSYDISFTLGSYNVYGKIVNTIKGTSAAGGAPHLRRGGVVDASSGIEVQPSHAVYTIELEVMSARDTTILGLGATVDKSGVTNEKAKLSVLYEY